MYIPPIFKEDDLQKIADLVRDHPLGLVVSSNMFTSDGVVSHDPPGQGVVPIASPLPFFFTNDGDQPLLRSHMARANPHWEQLSRVDECLVVFQGENNYVSPSWYPSKDEHHRVVPTWNYEMVQMRGRPVLRESSDWLHEQVNHATNMFERNRAEPWHVTDAPDQFVDSQLRGIIGLEIVVTDIQAKWKMSQNKNKEDYEGVKRGLCDARDPHQNVKMAKKF